jgi:hypothetical protein
MASILSPFVLSFSKHYPDELPLRARALDAGWIRGVGQFRPVRGAGPVDADRLWFIATDALGPPGFLVRGSIFWKSRLEMLARQHSASSATVWARLVAAEQPPRTKAPSTP